MTDKNKIIDRIVKLFRLGGQGGMASNGTEAEMMAAVTKARQLMTEHNISMADIHGVTDKASADRVEYEIKNTNAYTRKIRDLARYDQLIGVAVAKMFDVRVLYYSGKHNHGYSSVRFLGEITDAAIAVEVFHIMLTHVRKETRRIYGGGNSWGIQHTSYAEGYAHRLAARAEEAAKAAAPESVALVLYSKAAAIARYHAEHVTVADTSKDRKAKKKDRDLVAYNRGYRDGGAYNMDFGKAVKGQTPGE